MNHFVGQALAQKDYKEIHLTRHLLPFEDHKFLKSADTRVMVRGKGLYLWDEHGNRFLDALSGLWCTALGYGRPELIEAAARQMETLSYCSQFFNTTHPAVAELSSKLFDILPASYGRILYTNSGSEANEILIKMVRRFWQLAGKPDKKILIARHNGYHGATIGSASLGGMKAMHEFGGLPIADIHHIPEPYWFGYEGALTEQEFGLQAAQELEIRILELGADKVGAFVAEPFQGAGGMIFPPSSYWPEIQRICEKYDVLICADEVVGGFGRTGRWFAHEYFGFEPDMLAIAKGLTSGYIPMGGLVLSRRIGDALADCGGVFAHGLTYQGHPVAAAVALASLRLLDEGGIIDQVESDTGPYLQRCLRQALGDHVLVGEIQGVGAVAALQLAYIKEEKKRFVNEGTVGQYCMRKAMEHGMLLRAAAARLIVAPALVATHGEIDELVAKLQLTVDDTARALKMM
ncbi:aminotransferase [Herbaspirillum sp. RV1423]|uniref:aminotransferase n=1 Tax=Herbaspirillum sp. RV1423 TaxID=1443993 RepID=UPI0004BA21BC|nr:aminotransferase [Herbaspirillum sp. RV1423]